MTVLNFEFATAGQIVFGSGSAGSLGGHALRLLPSGGRVLVVLGLPEEAAHTPLLSLVKAGLAAETLRVSAEPSVEAIAAALPLARTCGLLVGLGGGAAIDTAKALAALAANPGEPLDYLEVVGRGQPLSQPSLPCIAMPTTAGTGAEVTRNAVLTAGSVKVSLRSASMLPRLALVDPELTYSLPPAVTAASGLDALTQLIEPFLSPAANPLTDAFCRDGIRRAAAALPKAFHTGDPAARQEMCLASLFGGLALANARLGAVHGLAGVLGGLLHAPHGALCAALLPNVLEANYRALLARQPDSQILARFAELAALLTGRPDAAVAEAIQFVRALAGELHIPRLGVLGLSAGQIPGVAAQAQKASSMKGNPLPLTDDELVTVLEDTL